MLRHFVFVCAFVVLGVVPARAGSEPPFGLPKTPYAADVLVESQGHSFRGKVWRSGLKERREMHMGGNSVVFVMDHQARKAWLLFPKQRRVMEQPRSAARKYTGHPALNNMRKTSLGSEKVDGEDTTKFRIEGKDEGGQSFGAHMWITEDQIIMKVEPDVAMTGEKVVIALANLKRGAQDPALFQVPKGWARMQMGGPAMPPGGGATPGGGAAPGGMSQAQIDKIVAQMRRVGASQSQIDAFLRQMGRK